MTKPEESSRASEGSSNAIDELSRRGGDSGVEGC